MICDVYCKYVWGSGKLGGEHWTIYQRAVEFHPDHIKDTLIEIGMVRKEEDVRISGNNIYIDRVSKTRPMIKLMETKMFTESELKEIAEAHEAVYRAIQHNFGFPGSDTDADMRAAEEAATHIVCAKIIADATEGLRYRRNHGGVG